MKLEITMADPQILQWVGARLERIRLAKNWTQKEVAERAGLGVRTVQRLESGEAATQLLGFLRVCRVLGLLERLGVFIPEQEISPMEQLKLRGRQRRRATGGHGAAPGVAGAPRVAEEGPWKGGAAKKPWKWGDPE